MRTESLVAAPLTHRDQVMGVVEVINPKNRQRFTNRDVELATVFANLASVAATHAQAFDQVSKHNRALQATQPSQQIIGTSPAIGHVLKLCRKVAIANATVLLYGETGTGKEITARAIHSFSDRAEKPFIAINCAALPESLLESELFGHEKGAFTGATGQKLGRFELADGGTLFLDEIGELSPAIQAKLLRVLQEREFVRVGGTQTITCNVRIIAATNRRLSEEMKAGRFREDLYYRLNVFPIHLPPLRERMEDLPALIEHFMKQIAPSLGVAPPEIDHATLHCLMNYHWPGNIRELRNVIERCALLADGQRVTVDNLPPEVARAAEAGPTENVKLEPTGSKLADHERGLILKALEDHDWNQSAAARALGISRDHLRYRVKKYKLSRPGK
jgi:two-component system NtrC family response regulator